MANGAAKDAASFWAQKRKQVDNGPAIVHQSIEPIPLTSPKKDGSTMVFKRAHDSPNGHPGVTVAMPTSVNGSTTASEANGLTTKPTFFNWADDEDGDMLAEFSQSGKKTLRIQELESVVVEKDASIRELHGMVDEKDNRIDDLEGILEAKDKRIGELEAENHKQFLHIQELVAEVDDKDRRNQQLDAELDQKGARIRMLELEVEEQTKASNKAKTSTEIAKEMVLEHTASTAHDDHLPAPVSPKVMPEAPVMSAKMSPHPAPDPPQAASPRTPSSIPAARDINEPVFATPDTIKKAQPVPPAPKLKLGIDMSKYGKKPEPKAAVKAASKPSVTKRSAISDVVPSINPNKDIRKMTRAEREPFGNGPTVSIVLGNSTMGTVPKYMLMQCSDKAFGFFNQNPTASSMRFPTGSMDADAVKQHIEWMQMHTHCGRVFSLHLTENNDSKNLQIARAARVLGLNNTYVGHFTKQYCDRIRDRMPSYELMAMIDDLAYPENDPIFDCLANNIANQRQRGNLPHPEQFDKFLTSHPKLAAAIKKIEDRFDRKAPKKGNDNGGKSGFAR